MTDPVKCQGFIATELTGKLQEWDRVSIILKDYQNSKQAVWDSTLRIPADCFALHCWSEDIRIFELYYFNFYDISGLPWGTMCKQRAASCWWERYRIHNVISGWEGCAESCRPETWSHQCCRRNKGRPPVKGWQICPVGWQETDGDTNLDFSNFLM